MEEKKVEYRYFSKDPEKILLEVGKEKALVALSQMLHIRQLELRGEAAYQQGKVGGFYHSYMGQEAIQVGCLAAVGQDHWFTTTYRCHALAYLLGASADEILAELYGKETGNAKGRGGSMHLYADRLLGGLAIVGGHVPIATGAAFSLKYLDKKGQASFCFMGDGAVVQGAVHESLNLAALWRLPALYVIENNQWGMGTAVARAVCAQPIAEHLAKAYDISSYTVDGSDFLQCFAVFQAALQEVVTTSKPVLIEAVVERFRGHSISDPGLYRSKEALQHAMEKDPILLWKEVLLRHKWLSEASYQKMEEEARETILRAVEFAEKSPFPDPICLEEGVFAQEEER